MYDITVLVSILLSLYVKNAVDKVGRIFHADILFWGSGFILDSDG